MAEFTVSVKGLREVTRSFKQYEGAVDDLKTANAAISSKVAQSAVATTPKLTGRLASTVKGNRAVQRVQIKAGGARVPYAGVIEYGWPARNIEAQPYLRRAAWTNKDYVIQQYSSNLESIKRRYIAN
jgi:carbon monoxide dehydrogenase subunit G